MLADIYSKKAVSQPNAAASNPLPLELKPWLSLSKQDQQSVVLFSGAVIQAEQKTVCGKDSASCLAVLIKIEGVTILYQLLCKNYRVLIIFKDFHIGYF